MVIVYLGLGSNVGDRLGNVASAVERLEQKMRVQLISSIYETDPVGYDYQPQFFNAVVGIETGLTPVQLFNVTKKIEADLGRTPSFRNAPRIIDIDILLYDELIMTTKNLVIPHPRMAERAFVLVPLLEIAPDVLDPRNGQSFKDYLSSIGGLDGVRLIKEASLT